MSLSITGIHQTVKSAHGASCSAQVDCKVHLMCSPSSVNMPPYLLITCNVHTITSHACLMVMLQDYPRWIFDYGYTLAPNWPEKESPFSGWSESSKLYSFGLSLWLFDYSFNRHIFLYDGIRHTSASGMSHFSWHPSHGLGKNCKCQRNNCFLPLLWHLAGWASMLSICFLGYAQVSCNLTVGLW